jgi:hypothetical protein
MRWRAYGLQPGGNDDAVTMKTHCVHDDITEIDSYAEPHLAVAGPSFILSCNFALDVHGALHCVSDAIERDQHRITGSLPELAAMGRTTGATRRRCKSSRCPWFRTPGRDRLVGEPDGQAPTLA